MSSETARRHSNIFQEATDSEMVLWDDDPDHFEFALKFMYTLEYDIDDIKDNKLARFALAKGVSMVADKYKIKRLVQSAAEDIKCILTHDLNSTTLSSIISHHYTMPTACDEEISHIVASHILQKHHTFVRCDEFARVCTAHPVFASDLMALMRRVKCEFCEKTIIYNIPSFNPRRAIWRCPECDFNR